MNVSHILENKGRNVLSVSPGQTLLDVVDVLAAKGVGALVIVDDGGGLVGIISERDIVRVIAEYGSNALDHLVSDHMTRHVVTATPEENLDDVMSKMSNGRFRHVPIMEKGRLAGIISSGDAVKYRLDLLEAEQAAFREYLSAG